MPRNVWAVRERAFPVGGSSSRSCTEQPCSRNESGQVSCSAESAVAHTVCVLLNVFFLRSLFRARPAKSRRTGSAHVFTLITRKVFPPCTNTSPKPSSGSGPDRSSPSASLLRDSGDPSTTTLIGSEAIGAPV